MAIDTRVDSTQRTTRRRSGSSRGMNVGLPIVVFFLLLGLFYLAALYYDKAKQLPFLVPYPHLILKAVFTEPAFQTQLVQALGSTLLVAVVGLVIAVVIGMIWAVIMAQAKWLESALFPYAVVLLCIPILALVPLIGSLFGYEFKSRVIVTVLFCLFPMIASTLFGLQSIDKGQRELFQLQGAGRFTLLMKLRFPAALPSIFVGLRNAAGLAVIGAVVADQFFQRGNGGLGVLISIENQRLNGPEMYAAIFTASILGVLVFVLFNVLRRLAIGKWYDQN
ncbi:nitrate ABC transporter permease [Frondihabitans sucicola]|uniref:Nitrate ABC transporter permease n=1 Tax=Frondihabitans sucicola TaxID=1268041 RepID=A0ABM8GJ96_9MICO|nr:ABC transporter permease [Frondihabitans sucicola]BDZ48424.1 nitrate ABC transporter permease [Frondihabitans sucicola]